MSTFVFPSISLERDPVSHIRTLPDLVEFHVKNNPQHLFCIQAKKPPSEHDAHLFTPVSYKRLEQAIFRCQSWLEDNAPNMNRSFSGDDKISHRCAPVAILMESHVGLAIFILTLMGMGIPVVLLSTRLSPLAINHLLQVTGTRSVIVSQRLIPQISEATALGDQKSNKEFPLGVYVAADYEQFLNEGRSQHGQVAHPNHFISEDDRNALILHSSGTSGLPKPIYCSHRHFLGFSMCHDLSESEMHGLTLSTSPFFHGFGLVPMCMSLGLGKTICLPPPHVIPTGTSVAALLEESTAKVLLTVPSIIEEIALLPDDIGIRTLRNLDFVAFGGGMPKESIGRKLNAVGVRLINHYGATETGPMSPFFVPNESYDWHFIKLRLDTLAPLEVQLAPVSAQEDTFMLSLRPFGWTDRFELQDLLVRKPGSSEEEMTFSIKGRIDDLICLATGEKVRPTILEALLQQHEQVKAATAFGDGRFELGVIVESVEVLDPDQVESFKTSIWPIIEQAGQAMDAHARISSRVAILVLPPNQLPRSDKGTILRLEVAKNFSREIDEVYRNLEANVIAPPLDSTSPESTIRRLVEDSMERVAAAKEWNNDDDFFEIGMDSLQAATLRRLLRATLKATCTQSSDWLKPEQLSDSFIYQHASVNKLSRAISLKQDTTNDAPSLQILNELVNIYSGRESVRSQKTTIVMTGATGSLGSYVLNVLLHDPSVDRIICFNRPTQDDAVARQRLSLNSRGIPVKDELFAKVEILDTDTATKRFGLGEKSYEDLAREVTHIIHIAWPMNFKMGLSSFRPAFSTLQNLVQLASDAHFHNPWKRPRLLFASSISTVGNYPRIEGTRFVPESAVDDHRWSLELGYAKAKLVCEMIVQRASEDHPEIEVGISRIGQMCGSTNGYWNPNEHFAALVASSQIHKKLPKLQGTLSWIPVDLAASVMVDILFNPLPLQLVYHLENPVRQDWQGVIATLVNILGLPADSVVSMEEWLEVIASDRSEESPARALLDFFTQDFVRMSDGSIVLETTVTRAVSTTLRKMSRVSEENILAYVNYWKSIHLLK